MTWTSTPPAAATPAGQSCDTAAPAAAVPDSQSFNAAAPAGAVVAGASHLIYSSDFSAGVDGWTGDTGATLAGNTDAVGPVGDVRNNCLEIEYDLGNQYAVLPGVFTIGQRYRLRIQYLFFAANVNLGNGQFANVYDKTTVPQSLAGSGLGGVGDVRDEWFEVISDLVADGTDLTIGSASGFINPGDILFLGLVEITAAQAPATPDSQSFNSTAPAAATPASQSFNSAAPGVITPNA